MRAHLFVVLSLAACVRPAHPPLTGRTEHWSLDSKNTHDSYALSVRLPPAYDANTAYPMVLQLDATFAGLDELSVTAGFASALEAAGTLQPTIVVGIGYDYPDGPKTGRFRDFLPPLEHPSDFYVGGAPAYHAFLQDELLPFLDDHYRLVGARQRALFGHSFGGLFALYALFVEDPPVFSAIVAASPSILFDGGSIYAYESQYAATKAAEPASVRVPVLLSAGLLEGPDMNVYVDDMAARLAAIAAPALQKSGVDHLGNIAPSFRAGLLMLAAHGWSP